MGQSFDRATRGKSAADFSRHPQVYDRYKDFYYAPFWENDSLKFMEYRLDHGDTVHKRIETIKYIVGSGQHTNSHMWTSNGYVFQAPLTFYTQKQQWDLPPGFENGNNSRFNRMIGLECMTCHNGYPEFQLGAENKYNLVKTGIDCERCHGPGSIHVREKSAGIFVDTSKAIDYSIVNPAKLPVDLQFDVCQRCHIQGNAVLNEGKSFFDFKPGMKLSEVMNVFMPLYQGREEEHIMASHAERLKMSKCYLGTLNKIEHNKDFNKNSFKPYKNALTCVTCHNPHISVKATDATVFNATCSSCHAAGKDPLCKEDKNALAKASNNCVSCHMPFNGAIDIPHVSVHDHKISIPSQKRDTEGLKKFIGINCINNVHPPATAIAEAYINYNEKFGLGPAMLDSALRYIPHQSTDEIKSNIWKLVHVYYLKNEFQTVLNYVQKVPGLLSVLNKQNVNNADAWTCYRIAESYEQTGNAIAAADWFHQAFVLTPFSAEFANKYGSALAALNKTNDAKAIFEKLTAEHPEYAPGFSNLGYLLLSTEGNQKLAEALYSRALYLDPDYVPGLLNMTGLFLLQNNKKQAVILLNHILKKEPGNEQAKAVLLQLKTKS
jgi:tetratricopeptide (TPR) repeat protein